MYSCGLLMCACSTHCYGNNVKTFKIYFRLQRITSQSSQISKIRSSHSKVRPTQPSVKRCVCVLTYSSVNSSRYLVDCLFCVAFFILFVVVGIMRPAFECFTHAIAHGKFEPLLNFISIIQPRSAI